MRPANPALLWDLAAGLCCVVNDDSPPPGVLERDSGSHPEHAEVFPDPVEVCLAPSTLPLPAPASKSQYWVPCPAQRAPSAACSRRRGSSETWSLVGQWVLDAVLPPILRGHR